MAPVTHTRSDAEHKAEFATALSYPRGALSDPFRRPRPGLSPLTERAFSSSWLEAFL
jgi:hypothetical protein